MIHTDKALDIATIFNTETNSTGSAPIDKDLHIAPQIANHQHCCLADRVGFKVARIGRLSLQPNPMPNIASKEPLLLQIIKSLLRKHLESHSVHT